MKISLRSSTASRVDRQRASAYPAFEWAMAFFSTWFVVGLYLDGWAHTNRLPDTFFTPWHAIIYSGVLGVTLVLVGTSFMAWRRGAPWWQAFSEGYRLSVLGADLFLIAGGADLVWHTVFGH